VLVRDTVKFDETVTFFLATFRGDLGDRLFLSVPEQPAVGEGAERTFVLREDLSLRITIANRGLFGQRRGVKIKEIPARQAPDAAGPVAKTE
jgi:hypothetical protein